MEARGTCLDRHLSDLAATIAFGKERAAEARVLPAEPGCKI